MGIKDEFEAIHRRSQDGLLHVDDALEFARKNRDSELHAKLEWDNRVAGDEWRRQQIRQLIRVYYVQEDRSPAVVSLTTERYTGGGYRLITDVMQLPELRRTMVDDALDELNRVMRKYEWITQLAGIWESITRAMDERKAAPPPDPVPPPPRGTGRRPRAPN